MITPDVLKTLERKRGVLNHERRLVDLVGGFHLIENYND